MSSSFAGVYLLDAPFAIDRVYDYAIPRSLCDEVHRGSFVTVPFGKSNRHTVVGNSLHNSGDKGNIQRKLRNFPLAELNDGGL